MAENDARNHRKTVIGTVISAKSSKTITVERERRFMHPLYGKIVKRHSKMIVHDDREIAAEGDRVEIVESRPISRTKRWRLLRVVQAGDAAIKAAAPDEILAEESDEAETSGQQPAADATTDASTGEG